MLEVPKNPVRQLLQVALVLIHMFLFKSEHSGDPLQLT